MITDEYLPAWKKLHKRIAGMPDSEWNMENYCGSACCLAGNACKMEGKPTNSAARVRNNAAKILGMNERDKSYVFCGYWSGKCLDQMTRKDGLRYLDKVIATRNPLVTI